MTDQKIEEIREYWAVTGAGYTAIRSATADIMHLITERDRLKAELNDCSSLIGDQAKVMVARSNRILELNAELATLKASGTFSDGVKKLRDLQQYVAANCSDRIMEHINADIGEIIRALTPQPRPDAQAQRERELALIDHAIRYECTHGGVIGVYAPEGLIKCLEAFDRRHHD